MSVVFSSSYIRILKYKSGSLLKRTFFIWSSSSASLNNSHLYAVHVSSLLTLGVSAVRSPIMILCYFSSSEYFNFSSSLRYKSYSTLARVRQSFSISVLRLFYSYWQISANFSYAGQFFLVKYPDLSS